MDKSSKPDYRQFLNTMLLFYYESDGAFLITHTLHRNGIDFSINDIITCINTLIEDGHVKHLAPGYTRIPVCIITGSGRVFHENGGYKDDSTHFDKIVKWAKNNKVFAWVLISFFVVTAFIGVVVSLITIYEFLNV